MKKALYAGSFDPFTKGHEDIVLRALKMFDQVTIVVAVSPHKRPLFSAEQRVAMLKAQYGHLKTLKVESWSGLIVEYAKQNDIDFIVRGLRTGADFDVEFQMASMNHKLNQKVETILLPGRGEHSLLSSSLVREVFEHGGDVAPFVPEKIFQQMQVSKK